MAVISFRWNWEREQKTKLSLKKTSKGNERMKWKTTRNLTVWLMVKLLKSFPHFSIVSHNKHDDVHTWITLSGDLCVKKKTFFFSSSHSLWQRERMKKKNGKWWDKITHRPRKARKFLRLHKWTILFSITLWPGKRLCFSFHSFSHFLFAPTQIPLPAGNCSIVEWMMFMKWERKSRNWKILQKWTGKKK